MNKQDRKQILLIYAMLLKATNRLNDIKEIGDLDLGSWKTRSKFKEAEDEIERAKDMLLNKLGIEY